MSVLITGAGRGLGRTLCERAKARSIEVIGLSRSPAPRDWNSAIPFFVSDLQTIRAANAAIEFVISHSGGNKSEFVLFNNAGLYLQGPSASYTDEQLRAAFDSNFVSFFNMTKIFSERFDQGTVVNMCAYNTIYPSSDSAVYGALKAAIARATESFRCEFREQNKKITICNVFSASINTWSERREEGAIPKEDAADFLLDVILNKFGIQVESIVVRAK
jgi:NAD(P)-dependent dehydrogenase (short-subunit alcohol dehydrogenase family)